MVEKDNKRPVESKLLRKRGVVFIAWGDRYAAEVSAAIRRSPGLEGYPKFLVTDKETRVDDLEGLEVIRVDFRLKGMMRKSEFHNYLPDSYSSFLFLDSDVTVLDGVEIGFEAAERCDFALAHANHYFLPEFKGFSKIMEAEGVKPAGQAQFNAGVVFFSTSKKALLTLRTWEELIARSGGENSARLTDQPFLSLALILNAVDPFVLTRNFNFRPQGGPGVGQIYIWHSWLVCPEDVNESVDLWRSFYDRSGKTVTVASRRRVESKRQKLSHFLKSFVR